jgi:ABC-2 type transport system permease protein
MSEPAGGAGSGEALAPSAGGRTPLRDEISAALRAYPALLRIGFASAVAYRAEFFVWMFTTNMPLVMLALWSAVARGGPVQGYSSRAFVAYYLTTLVVRLLTGCWVVWGLTYEIREGLLGLRLLRPLHPLLAFSAENLGATPLRCAVCLPVLAVLFATARAELTSDPLSWLLLPLALLGAFLISFFVQALIGTLALYVESATGLFQLWHGFFAVLSGYLVPLDLFPPAVRAVAEWLPFRFTLSYPVELALGRLGHGRALLLFCVQWGTVLFFGGLTQILWRRGLRRFGAFGG